MTHTMTPPQITAFTIGVEEEYQLVDPATGVLRDRATVLREGDWTGEITPELQESTIEIGTPVCRSAAEAEAQLRRLRVQTATVARAHDVAIVAAGLHPFFQWEGHRRPPLHRYRSIEARYGRIAADEHIYGMHVHVAIPNARERLRIVNIVRHYLPHLLALSASSPFLEGADTGFASFRTIMWRRWPSSGVPPRFDTETEYRHYVDTLLSAGVIQDPFNLYWSLRTHPTYPTIEFRVTDVCPNLRDAVGIVSFVRALVYAAARGVLTDDAPRHLSATTEQEFLRTNEWAAARDGLDARIINTSTGVGQQSIREAIRRVLGTVWGGAEELGDTAALASIETILERGNAADRMRAHYEQKHDLRDVVDWLVRETLAGTNAADTQREGK